MTVTSASWSVDAGLPSEEVSPHPITAAMSEMYWLEMEGGRQIGAAVGEGNGVIGDFRVSMEKS